VHLQVCMSQPVGHTYADAQKHHAARSQARHMEPMGSVPRVCSSCCVPVQAAAVQTVMHTRPCVSAMDACVVHLCCTVPCLKAGPACQGGRRRRPIRALLLGLALHGTACNMLPVAVSITVISYDSAASCTIELLTPSRSSMIERLQYALSVFFLSSNMPLAQQLHIGCPGVQCGSVLASRVQIA
jgi:hypothetical protein